MIAQKVVENHGGNKGQLIGILQDIQAHHRYLPKKEMEAVAKLLDIPRSQVYSVATFFKAFSLEPKGAHTICVCMGTACHVRGAKQVLDELQRELKISAGETTKDKFLTLETVNCVGACALGPVAVVDGKYAGKLNTQNAKDIIKNLKKR